MTLGIPGVVGLIALEGLLRFSFPFYPFYPFYPYNNEYHYGTPWYLIMGQNDRMKVV